MVEGQIIYPPPTCGVCGSPVKRLLTGAYVCTNPECKHG